ncbi:MAG TPA: glycosyltransferase [Galbitalea sp.]|jgi:glycosyltransferase involved in cell wall biosynthesis|nr:glycosyltransferase [Galbitalea sp.]
MAAPIARSKRALVASDSPVARDPRVLRQVRWLTELGWSVDTLGRGEQPPESNGKHYAMPRRSGLFRAFAYLFFPNRLKYAVLVRDTIPEELRIGQVGGMYDLVVLNEIELLPWFAASRDDVVSAAGHAHVDLHEYAPSQRSGLAYRLVFKRFRDWMIGFIGSPTIDTRSVVATGIGRLYAEKFGFALPTVVRSCPDFVDQAPTSVDPADIKLVHHGIASLSRGLGLMIEAMKLIDDRFSLELMLVGGSDAVETLHRQAESLGDRVRFRDPVDVRQVADVLNAYDLEVIFFPPLTENLRFALPNKFFEAVQARLGLVIGESSEMVELVTQYGNGVVVPGWEAADLARSINALTPDAVRAMKESSARAAHDLSSESEKAHFVEALGLKGGRGGRPRA